MDGIKEAEILSGALPYIQKYSGKVVVVKYGGNAMLNEELKQNVMTDIVLLNEIGVKVVLVHGGGPDINDMLKRVGIESKFVNGLRYTDEETMKIVQMVLAGQTNKNLVALLNSKNGRAVGLCGIDSNIIETEKFKGDNDLGYVGSVKKIHTELIFDLLEKNYIPVIASVGCDENHQAYNVNADVAAAYIAKNLAAENMVIVSDIPGILKDPKDPKSLISKIYYDEIDELISTGCISGGMIPKIDSIRRAISGGVKKSVIIDGRIPHAILIEILSKQGIGTMIRRRRENE